MGVLEALIAALVAALVALAGFFKAWQGAKGREKAARVREIQANARLDHAKRTQAAADAGRKATQVGVDKARQTAREGRRNHFESDR